MISQDNFIARVGTPILDLKPYIPGGDAIPEAVTPALTETLPAPGRLAFSLVPTFLSPAH